MSRSTVHSSAAAPKKIGAAGLIVRLILFVLFLSLPFLAAGTLNWPQGLIQAGASYAPSLKSTRVRS